jgi:hypothetical protein
MSRWKAAALHLTISLVIAVAAGSLIYFVWYPQPYFQVSSGSTLILLLMGVDVVVGPLLTLVVFKAGKKGLKFDLAVIAVLQIAAFCYGIHIIADARPVFVVAEVDRLVVVAANELDDKDLAEAKQPEYASPSWNGPRLVGVSMPKAGKETLDLAISTLGGKDLDRYPKYYVPYTQVADALLAHSRPLSALTAKGPAEASLVESFVASSGETISDLSFVPLKGRLRSYAIVLSSKTKLPLTTLPIDPW